MDIADFTLEQYFARWEFSAPYLLCSSDADAVSLRELLALADDDGRRMWDGLSLGYTETLGHPLLRREIASLYRDVRPEDVIVCSGAQEPIFLLMHALVRPGDRVVVVTPCYQSLAAVPEAIGAEVVRVPLVEAEGFDLDVGRVAAALAPGARLLVLNYPHSPTGALLARDKLDELVALAARSGTVVLGDEVYRYLEHDESARLPAAVEAFERGVSLGVMSKTFGLAGLRIGWLVCRDPPVLAGVARLKHYTTICNAAPSEVLALIGLRARAALWERSRRIVAANLARLDRFFAEHAARVTWVRPRAGTVAFPRLRGDVPIDRFAEELVAAEGVLILPGTVFDHPGSHFRIGFGRANMPESLARFERFLAAR